MKFATFFLPFISLFPILHLESRFIHPFMKFLSLCRFLLVGMSMFCSLPLQAQNLDSLRIVWHDSDMPDSSRLNALSTLIWTAYMYSQPDSAFYYAQFQQELATASERKREIARAQMILGTAQYLMGAYEEAMNFYDEGLRLSQEMENTQYIGKFLDNIANIYRIQGKHNLALEYHRRSFELFTSINDRESLAASYHNFASIYDLKGDYDSALLFFQQSIAISQEIGSEGKLATTYNDMARLYSKEGNVEEAIQAYERSQSIFEKLGNQRGIAATSFNLGNIYFDQGNFARAIENFTKCLKISELMGNKRGTAIALNGIGAIYNSQEDDSMAMEYYQRALHIHKEMEDQSRVANVLSNIGMIYMHRGAFEQALDYLDQSLEIREALGNPSDIGIALHYKGILYREMGQYANALPYHSRSLEIFRQVGDKPYMIQAINSIGINHFEQKQYAAAIENGLLGLRLSQEVGTLEETLEATQLLYQAYKATGKIKQALEMHEQFVVAQDSLDSEENQRAVLRQEYQYQYEKQALSDSLEFAQQAALKDLELETQEANLGRQRIALISTGLGLLLIVALAVSIYRGKKRSDKLLLNILPYETARELKSKGYAEAREYEQATILFSDFKGFTQLAAQLSAQELVAEIDHCFKAFDDIITIHGLEKIKTIGDAYMAAGGLPDPLAASPLDVVHAAMDMQTFIQQRKQDQTSVGLPYFEMRIGIHTGPVVAGIVGVKKFQYDVWGDTVNTASRMESHSEVGQVNISDYTYQLIKDQEELLFTQREAIEVKGKGKMEMYFVERKTVVS